MRHDIPHAPGAVTAPPDTLLTAAEAATRMRVSRSTVYNLVASGDLRSHRAGKGKIRPRGLRIWASSIEDHLSGSTAEPTAEPMAEQEAAA